LPFEVELYPTLSTYNGVHDTSSMVNVVKREVSVPAVQVVVGLTLTILALAFLIEMTLDKSAFYVFPNIGC